MHVFHNGFKLDTEATKMTRLDQAMTEILMN